MELHQLRYLRAVVRNGSVTAAASQEHVAQPSVSKQLRLLEHELGVPLFHRVGRRIVPTDAALELAECAGRVLDDLNATATAIAGPGSVLGGSVRICATETLSDHLLPPALALLIDERPAVNVRVEMLGTDDAIAHVLAGDVDFALVPLPYVDSRLEAEAILAEDVLVAVPPGHRWAEAAAIPRRDLLREPRLLLSMPGHGLRAQVDESAAELGEQVVSRVELRSQQALLAMVAAGAGVCLAPRMSVEGRDDVVSRPLDPPLTRTAGWVRRRGRHLSPAGARLLEILGASP
ncbi:MAG: LysR family transcriptional regulator [Dehalococcoidia bacterium]|nr:LysR family transcriptional regulator [Dehalococcoidia bacterium]